jgi:trimethylamine--corrinoid protein Co-methyltransferase
MRHGTTPMGSIETMMIDCAAAQVGKRLGFPTHAYMGLSDAKVLGAQAGLESAMGVLLATLGGVNVVSGPGMLDFESAQSPEKLVIDAEICAQARRLAQGIALRGDTLGLEILEGVHQREHFLDHPTTLRWFSEEVYRPSPVIDRTSRPQAEGGRPRRSEDEARQQVRRILDQPLEPVLDERLADELERIMTAAARAAGLECLPAGSRLR